MITKDMLEHRHDLDYLNTYDNNFLTFLDMIEIKILFIFELLMTIILDLCLWPLEIFYYFYKKKEVK